MSTPSCHQNPLCRDDLRPFTAIPGKTAPQSGETRRSSSFGSTAVAGRYFAAISGTAILESAAKSKFSNILPEMQCIAIRRKPVSNLFSTICSVAERAASWLAPYFSIFYEQVIAGQQLADYPRKILKTNDFKYSVLNIFAWLSPQNIEIRDLNFFT